MFFRARLPRSAKVALSRPVTSLMNRAGNQYASSRRFCFQSRCYVHSIAVEIISLDDHIAEMQTDTKYNPLCFGPFRVHFVHGLLELNRCRQRVACAGKFCERPITHQLDQPAPVSRKRWFEAAPSMLTQSRQRSALVAPHQAGVANDIGCETAASLRCSRTTGAPP